MPRSFTDEIRDLRGGALSQELTEKMAELVLAVSEHRKPGRLTLDITIRPMSATGTALIVTDKLTVKLPFKEVAETLMFPTPEGSILVDNPKQSKLDFKVAPAAPPVEGEVKSVSQPTAPAVVGTAS